MSLSTLAVTQAPTKNMAIEDCLIGDSAAMVLLRDMVRRVANSSASVLICGASGSGKEVVARAIHAAGVRASKPYVAINCGAIPAELMESELFGHERGAFTGAQTRRTGHFENADKGTLFLDEIGDMRFDMQVKLLRVLEDGIVSRIGAAVLYPSTCVSFRQPTRISSKRLPTAAFVKICSSGWASLFCTCPPWPTGPKTSPS